MSELTVDVVVIGGGPAGLAASLSLGRAVKRVLLCDGGVRRNARAEHMHGFVTRDGIPPSEFRRIARAQLSPYHVVTNDSGVASVERAGESLIVRTNDGDEARCRRVLLAMGLVDELPSIDGLRQLWGQSIFACPYCHGWELRGRPWGMLVANASQLEHAMLLTGWTDDLVLFIDAALARSVDTKRVRIESRCVRRIVSNHTGQLAGVELEDRTRIPLAALVVKPAQQQTKLVRSLNLGLDERGLVVTDANAQTSMPGVHAAGDLAEPIQAAIVAAAAGTRAAYRMNLLLNAAMPIANAEIRGARASGAPSGYELRAFVFRGGR